jgi:tRNA A-37 threonylcarbamoyl transferase component Bud32
MSTPSTQRDRWIGKVIAEKFRVDALIGEGAMGCVYRGEHIALGKPIALKILHKHLSGEERIAKRFHREARAASRLSHPNSLSIIDFGEAEGGTLFIAMELLEGEPLQAVIDHDAPLSPARIGRFMVQTLRALDEAHHAGIIHRDLKPENVMVLADRAGEERVKVCDFGIAKIVEESGKVTAITKDGYVCGTPEYMAPEQARGEPIDPRTDIYAAGVMLYQLLCGRVPFEAESALGIITKHVMEEPVPPRRVRPEWGIPRSLEAIALRALAKKPADRFANAAEMASEIERAVRELGSAAIERLGEGTFAEDAAEAPEPAPASSTEEAAPAMPPRRAHGWWALALIAALAVFGFGLWLWLGALPEQTDAPPHAAQHEARVREPETREEPAPVRVEEPAPRTAPSEPPAVRAREPRSAPREEEPAPAVVPPPQDPESAALAEGRRLVLAGDLRGAIARFEEASRAIPSSATLQKELGRTHMRAGNVAQGIAAYRRYLELAPDAPDRAIVERIISQHGG